MSDKDNKNISGNQSENRKKMGGRKLIFGIAVILLVLIAGSVTAWAMSHRYTARINAPTETVQEELGTYTIPVYEVEDANGMILAGYQVRLKSAQTPDGQELDASYGAVMIEEPGIYSFHYTADARNVKDVTVQVDFGDRTAPKISLSTDLPAFYITGNNYRMPGYTISGDVARDKCWAKAFYVSEDGKETELNIKSNRFRVEEKTGEYTLRIHVEDEAGNFNLYEYTRPVRCPENLREDVVLYFDEKFGESQVEPLESSKYTGEFVPAGTEGAKAYGDEAGSYRLTFSGEETNNNEGYVVMKVPAILDISNCLDLYMYVYNDTDQDVVMGSTWWNDQPVKKGEWTKVTWSVKDWGGANGNVMATNSNRMIGVNDISNTAIRVIFDYSGEVAPSGTLYFSTMRATMREPSVIEAGEHVTLDKSSYYIGDTVWLTADEVEGKTFDCFLVDGEPIAGDNFTATEGYHKVTAKYIDGKLTASNMTWGTRVHPADISLYGDIKYRTENNITANTICEADEWALSYDVVGGYDGDAETNQVFNCAILIGSTHIVEFQITRNGEGVLKWYGLDAWNVPVSILPAQLVEAFKNASPKNPVNVQAVCRGNDLYLFAGGLYIGHTTVEDKPLGGKTFGYGWRKESPTAKDTVITNVKAVAGSPKAGLYFDTVNAMVKIDDHEDLVVISGDTYTLPGAVCTTLDGARIKNGKYSVKVTDLGGNSYDVSNGKVQIPYKGAVTLSLNYTVGGLATVSQVTVQRDSGLVMDANEVGASLINKANYQVAYDADIRHGEDEGSVKVTVNEKDATVFLNRFKYSGYDYVEFYVYTEAENMYAGAWWLGDTLLNPGQWTRVRLELNHTNLVLVQDGGAEIWPNNPERPGYGNAPVGRLPLRFMGAESTTSFYVSSVTAYKRGNYQRVDVLDASKEAVRELQGKSQVMDILWDPFVRYGKEAGSAKVIVSGSDAAIQTEAYDFSGYDYVEFYVYTDAKGTQSGSWWCGDTALIPGRWTKVRIPLNHTNLVLIDAGGGEIWPNNPEQPGYGMARSGSFLVRFMGGSSGTEFYVSGIRACYNSKYDRVNVLDMCEEAVNELAGQSEVLDIAWDTQVKYKDEAGSAKVTVAGGEAAIRTETYDFTGYDYVEFYVYTDAKGTQSGSWWCGDTALNPGSWTKVQIPLDHVRLVLMGTSGEMWPNNPEQPTYGSPRSGSFLVRFMGGTEGTQFYVSSIKAYRYVPVKISTDGNVILDKTTYYPGETVTLTAKKAPDGMHLLRFMVNGKAISGNTFVAEAGVEYVIEAVYSDYAREDIFDAVEEAVAAVDNYRNISNLEWDTRHHFGEEAGSLKLTVGSGDAAAILENYDFRGYDYVTFYVYTDDAGKQAGTYWAGDTNLVPGQWNKVTVSLKEQGLVLLTEAGEIWPNNSGADPIGRFVIRLMNGNEGDVFYLSSVKAHRYGEISEGKVLDVNTKNMTFYYADKLTAQYGTEKVYDGTDTQVKNGDTGSLKVTVTGGEAGICVSNALTNDISMYDQVYFYVYTDAENTKAGGWWCGDTALTPGKWTKVTLTKEMRPQNLFGKSIFAAGPDNFAYRFMGAGEDTVFYVTSLYAENAIKVEVATKNCTTDKESYVQGETVTLTAGEAPEGIVFDSFIVNGVKITGNQFVLEDTEVSYRAEALYRRQVVGSVKVNDVSLVAGEETYAASNAFAEYVADKGYDGEDALVKISDIGSLKVTVTGGEAAVGLWNSLTDDISMYDQVYFYVYTENEGTQSGGWWCGDTALVPGQWTRITLKPSDPSYGTPPWNWNSKPIFDANVGPRGFAYRFMGGSEGTVFYVTSLYAEMAKGQEEAHDAVKVNDVATVKGEEDYVGSNATAVYVTDKVYDGDDAVVKASDKGSMKVTVIGGEAAVGIHSALLDDISMFNQVYFYVYTEAAGTQSGGWWCGDTALAPGQWTKVTLKSSDPSYGTPPWNMSGQEIFQVGPKDFAYRFMGGSEGTVFYVTSLYAEIK